MGVLKVLLFTTLLCLVAGDDKGFPPGPSGQNVTSTTSSTSSTTSSTTPSTTSVTTPSTNTTTTTTTPPTTSTSTPKPTTSSTTPPTTPSTTTTKTTTAQPTTAKPPTHIGKWVLNYNNTDKPCLILEGAIDIDIIFLDGKVNKTVTVKVNSSAVATGQCVSDETIVLSWGTPNAVSFNFKKTNDTKKYVINAIIVTLNVTVPGEKDWRLFVLAHNEDEFATPVNNSYKCGREQSLNLIPQTTKEGYSGKLRLSSLQLQAFHNSNSTKFDEALDCETYETPDVVPIAVGCALAALVIIVLVAYLIGRRRSQARGYLSM